MKKYALLGVLVAVVVSMVFVGTKTELFQGLTRETKSFNITSSTVADSLVPLFFDHPDKMQRLTVDVSFQYNGYGPLQFGKNYNWKLRCHSATISDFASVFSTFPTGSDIKILNPGDRVSSRGQILFTPDQLTKLKSGDGNLFCGFSYKKPASHSNVSYGFASTSIKKSYQLHINDDNSVEVE